MLGVKVDLRDVYKGFDSVKRRSKAVGPALRQMRAVLLADQRDHAQKQAGPDGGWDPLQSATTTTRKRTRARNKRNKFTPLRQGQKRKRVATRILGRLPTAFSVKYTPTSIMVESKIEWSGVHQDGGKVGRGAEIPARPFYWLSDKAKQEALKLLVRHCWKGWAKRGR